MTFYVDRILEAICETEKNAEEIKAAQPTLMRIGLSLPDGRTITVTSDPDIDLRRCAADRRVLQRHAKCGSDGGYCDDGGHGRDGDDPSYGCADLEDLAVRYGVEEA